MVLDGGNEIILANWPDAKHIIYNVNNDIPVKIPSLICVSKQKYIVQLQNRSGK